MLHRFTHLFLSLAFLNLGHFTFAQNTESCAFDALHNERLANDPDYAQSVEAARVQVDEILAQQQNSNFQIIEDTLEIPVVVHIIHTGTSVGVGANISNAQIQGAISALNDRFRKAPGTHGDADGVDTWIQFKLAQRDPDCNSTTGIVRVNGSSITNYASEGIAAGSGAGANEIAVKNLSRWPNTDYMNIWVVSEIQNNNGGFGIQGYAYFPGASAVVDGLVVQHTSFGTTGTVNSWNNLNRTVTHEVGHYLGLYHTFEGDSGGSSCPPITNGCGSGLGDCISDTDPHQRSGSNCPTGTNTCTGNAYGLVVHNYMDYSSQTCADMYTAGQKARMRAVLWGPRSSLLTSKAYLAPDTFNVVSAACTPQTTNLSNSFGMGIRNVSFDSLDVSSASAVPDSGYVDRMCSQVEYLDTNTTYSISISTGFFNDEDVRVFIDYNNDGDFLDSGELIFTNDTDTFHTGSFTTPGSPVLNEKLRLRVISDWQGNTTAMNSGGSCYTPQYGQVEDYAIIFADTANPPASLTASISATHVSCNGGNDGTATASASGGTSPFTYLWNTGGTTATITGLTAGNYTVTVTDNNSNTDSETVAISQPSALSIDSIVETPVTLNGGNDGELEAFVSGGAAPYTYSWSNGGTTNPVTNLVAGNYCLTVTDSNSCVAVSCDSVTQPSAGCGSDTVAPEIITQNITVYLNSSGTVSITVNDVDNGTNDTLCGISSMAIGQSSFSCSDVGANVISFSATDFNGNSATDSVTVTVVDTISPSFTSQNMTYYSDSSCSITLNAAALIIGSAADNCAIDFVSTNPTSLGSGNLGSNNVTVYAVDVNGNVDSQSVVVTIIDTTAPVIVTQNYLAPIGPNGYTNFTAQDVDAGTFDNCSSIDSIYISADSFSCQDLGAQQIMFTAIDASGNSASQMVTITVVDTTAPDAQAQNITVYLGANGTYTLSPSELLVSASDNCGIESYSVTPPVLNCADSGSAVVYLVVTDSNGNSAYAQSIVTVLDTMAPTFTAIGDTLYLDANGLTGTSVNDVISNINENCALGSISLTPTQFDCSHEGTTIAVASVSDINGNVNNQNVQFVILDTIAPTISCPENAVMCEGIFHAEAPVYNDNCAANLAQLNGPTDSSIVVPGNYTMTYSAGDAAVNMATCSYDLTVLARPIVDLGNDTTIVDSGTVTLDAGNPGSTYIWSVTNQGQTLDVNAAGTYWVKVVDSNGCGNRDTIVITFTVDVDDLRATTEEIKLYPNPARTIINLQSKTSTIEDIEISVYSMVGDLLIHETNQTVRPYQALSIQVGDLARGNYVIELKGAEHLSQHTIILQ